MLCPSRNSFGPALASRAIPIRVPMSATADAMRPMLAPAALGAAVAAVVEREDVVAGSVQAPGDVGVAAGVLGDAVGDHDERP